MALDYAIKKVKENNKAFGMHFPSAESVNLIYQPVENATFDYRSDWTAGFWSGLLWLAYEETGCDNLLEKAKKLNTSFTDRINKRKIVDTHDLGFLYTLSCIADYKITGDECAKATAVKAAHVLGERYRKKAKIIQVRGDLTDPDDVNSGAFIIDCCMNLPLLYWASEVTESSIFYEMAYNHAYQAQKYMVRSDYSTFQRFKIDVNTGIPLFGSVDQGNSDQSCWSRGQAWGIYGMILSYYYTKEPKFIETAKKLSEYFLSNLPEDNVCAWDLIYTENDSQRDTSAAAIAVCGLLEISKYLPHADEERTKYEDAAMKILMSLAENYTTKDEPHSNGILKHGVYSIPGNHGIDECVIWGDYFYLEALTRVLRNRKMYW